MSTRATYAFKAAEYHQSATFYIHHDYAAGAAHYLACMLALENTRVHATPRQPKS